MHSDRSEPRNGDRQTAEQRIHVVRLQSLLGNNALSLRWREDKRSTIPQGDSSCLHLGFMTATDLPAIAAVPPFAPLLAGHSQAPTGLSDRSCQPGTAR